MVDYEFASTADQLELLELYLEDTFEPYLFESFDEETLMFPEYNYFGSIDPEGTEGIVMTIIFLKMHETTDLASIKIICHQTSDEEMMHIIHQIYCIAENIITDITICELSEFLPVIISEHSKMSH